MYNAKVAATIAGLFGKNDYSDCKVIFVKETMSTREKDVILGDALPAHTWVLSIASDRFRYQLERWSDIGDGTVTGRKRKKVTKETEQRILRVPLANVLEVPSARAAIAFAYTGCLPAPKDADIRALLDIWRQSNYLQIIDCTVACEEELKSRILSPVTLEQRQTRQHAVLELFACDEELLPDTPSFKHLVRDAGRRGLIAFFEDVPTTLNMHLDAVLALSATGLELLLGSDDFGTDTECSVLLLLANWIDARGVHTIDTDTIKRLCELIRLATLSWPYLTVVLPSLPECPWFSISRAQTIQVAQYAQSTPGERSLLENNRALQPVGKWFTYEPRHKAQQRAFAWSVTRTALLDAAARADSSGQLERAYATFDCSGKETLFVCGFLLNLYISLHKDTKRTPGIYIHYILPQQFEKCFPILLQMCTEITVNTKDGLVAKYWDCPVENVTSWGYADMLTLQEPTWDDLLGDGDRLTGTLTVMPVVE